MAHATTEQPIFCSVLRGVSLTHFEQLYPRCVPSGTPTQRLRRFPFAWGTLFAFLQFCNQQAMPIYGIALLCHYEKVSSVCQGSLSLSTLTHSLNTSIVDSSFCRAPCSASLQAHYLQQLAAKRTIHTFTHTPIFFLKISQKKNICSIKNKNSVTINIYLIKCLTFIIKCDTLK